MQVKENMFGEFNEVTHLKTSLAKYSIEFNDLAVQIGPHRIALVFEAVRQTLHITVCENVCGQTTIYHVRLSADI